jgi:Ca2+-binding EF-hand superfamily protein
VLFKYLTTDHYDELLDLFRKLDVEKTGYITVENLQMSLLKVGLKVASSEIQRFIDKADYLNLGRLNYTEFLMATVNLKEICSDDIIVDTFNHFDA